MSIATITLGDPGDTDLPLSPSILLPLPRMPLCPGGPSSPGNRAAAAERGQAEGLRCVCGGGWWEEVSAHLQYQLKGFVRTLSFLIT